MNYKKYTAIFALVMLGIASCTDESLFPLPYNDREVAAYLRMYKVTSTSLDFTDISTTGGANTAFETVFEAVDEAKGANLSKVDFFVSLRRGTTATDEVLVKSVAGSAFTAVPEPTYSEYRRSTVKITAQEAVTALATLTSVPASFPSGLTPIAYPGSIASGDVFVFRWVMTMNNGKQFSTLNVQGTSTDVNNVTANIATGQFYSSPFIFSMTARTYTAGRTYFGDYTLTQRAIWSPAHNVFLHSAAFPAYLNQVLFPNQTVTLKDNVDIPTLQSTEREFTVNYKGGNVTMRINMEPIAPGFTGANGTATINNTLVPYGFPATTTNGNLGSVFIPIQSTKVQCSTGRELYWVTPTTGLFGNAPSTSNPTASNFLGPGMPQNLHPNRGVYRTDQTGIVAGQVFSISVDDDCDEYGRRNGYCSWTRRVYLTLTKI